MFGLMLTLTASSLLTAKFSPSPVITIPQETKEDICVANFTNFTNFNKQFKNKFGCLNNACWRSCYSDKDIEFWCYTSPIIKTREYTKCTYHSDCAPYWECLHPCQTGNSNRIKNNLTFHNFFPNYYRTDVDYDDNDVYEQIDP